MSIPISIDPLGTLGARPDYVKDGLILWFDGLLEPAGQHGTITNWVTGEVLPLAQGTLEGKDGFIYSDSSVSPALNPVEKDNGICCEIVARFDPTGVSGSISLKPWGTEIFRYISSGYYAGALVNENGFRWVNGATYEFPERKGKIMGFYVTKQNWVAYEGTPIHNNNNGAINEYDVTFSQLCQSAHCVRYYNRPLTEEEQLHNWKIDKLRFGE